MKELKIFSSTRRYLMPLPKTEPDGTLPELLRKNFPGHILGRPDRVVFILSEERQFFKNPFSSDVTLRPVNDIGNQQAVMEAQVDIYISVLSPLIMLMGMVLQSIFMLSSGFNASPAPLLIFLTMEFVMLILFYVINSRSKANNAHKRLVAVSQELDYIDKTGKQFL